MPRIEVEPAELQAAGGRQAALGGQIAGLCGQIRRVLEVLDTDGGYWLVIPDAPTVELWPTTPTAVFRALGQIFPLRDELAPPP